ncbi:MAG: hypothetical protein HUK22_08985 [Thermoguttaceae bacterium]|nr:hypothetical protein [Thermoguttaceae bacterium]
MQLSRVIFGALFSAMFGASFAVAEGADWTVRNLPREKATVVAHRGAGDLAPENCLSSLELTWGMGGTPEVDVRMTKDGHIMMFHDGNFARVMPDAPEEIKKRSLETFTYDEVRAFDIGAYRGEEFKGEKVLSIEELVAALKADPRRRIVIDVKKVDFEKLAAAISDVLYQTTLTSGSEADLARWSEICPGADATLWMGLGSYKDADVEKRFAKLRAEGFKGITRLQIHIAKDKNGALQPSPACIRAAAEELRALGIEFQTMPWRTKDYPEAATDAAFYKELMALGSAGFGTDRPDVAFAALDEFYAETPADWNARANVPLGEFHIQGHRGMGNEEPEGTLDTFRSAWAKGIAPEADIRMTKDGVVMSFHDNNFKRILPDVPDDVKKKGVKDFTFEECRKLDVGAYMGEKFAGQRMASLEEIVAALKEDRRRLVYFDVKEVDLKLVAELTLAVHPQIILASSNYEQLREWKKYAPYSKALLWVPTTWDGTAEDLPERFAKFREANFAGLDMLQIHVVVDEAGNVKPSADVLRACGNDLRKRGITFQTLSWTNGDKSKTYEVLLDAGSASFATDYPTETKGAIAEYYGE